MVVMVWVRSPVYFYKRNQTYYFSRAIPSDLRHRFNKPKIEVSLRTKSKLKAAQSAASLSDRLERYWDSLRMEMIYSRELGLSIKPQAGNGAGVEVTLSNALALYHRLKGVGKSKLFFKSSERNIRYLKECVGHQNLGDLDIADAGKFRDFLFDRGLSSSSVRRVFSSVRSVINLSIREQGLNITNVFSGTYIPSTSSPRKRIPIPENVLIKIQRECKMIDDEPRWLIALISDTGMRLAEACGLKISDIHLHDPCPYIDLVEHPWRSLKTPASSRKVPLVGYSLWASRRIVGSEQVLGFPKYCKENTCNANSASAALNKWLKPRLPDHCVIHSFRHSLRDRLRAVECPADVVDAIGGWSAVGVGNKYGAGYPLKVTYAWMDRAINK